MKRRLEKDLLVWKDRKDRRPLLLRGARQVDFDRRPEFKTVSRRRNLMKY